MDGRCEDCRWVESQTWFDLTCLVAWGASPHGDTIPDLPERKFWTAGEPVHVAPDFGCVQFEEKTDATD